MICGSCGMRMDGRAILACKERMKPIVESGHVPVISPMGNMPIVKDLVVDMGPFWKKIRDVKPWLDPGYDEATERERVVSQQQMNVIHKEALCIMCGCCVSECNAMESDPDFRGPAALAKGMRFVGDARDQTSRRAAQRAERRARDLGLHPVLLLQRALPEGRRPARRDRQARRRVREGGHRLGHGRQAREVVRHLGEDHRLAARDRPRPEDAGHPRSAARDEVRARSSPAAARCRRPARSTSRPTSTSRASSTTSSRSRAATGRSGIVQGERRSRRSSTSRPSERTKKSEETSA